MSEIVVSTARKTKKLWLWIGVAVMLLLIIGCLALSVYVGWNLTHPDRETIFETPAKYSLTYEDITFKSKEDGLTLKGWYLPAERSNGLTIIVAHGYGKNRLQDDVPVLKLAQSLVARGYNMMLFDFRNSGESEGDLTSVGQYEQRDLHGAIAWVKQNRPSKIALLGYSMGAATSLVTAADAPDVAAVVADSPFAQLRSYLSENLSVWSGLPEFPFTPLILATIPAATGTDPDAVDPFSAVKKIYPRPILFIHGNADKSIPNENSKRLSAKHPDKFQFWLTEGADHVGSYEKHAAEYVERVDKFLRAHTATISP